MSEENHHEDDMDILSKVIVDAIMKSKDVRRAIRKLSDSDESRQKSFMVLMLKVQNLVDSMEPGDDSLSREIHIDPDEIERQAKVRKPVENWKRKSRFVVDGKMETPQELAFREFLSKKFDQDEWLRKNGLTMD